MKADLEITENNYSLLDGELNPLRDYVITLGMSSGSKGVMFVLYSVLRECKSIYVNPYNYMGILADDINTAIVNARKKVSKFKISIDCDETFRERAKPLAMPFGKYKGMLISEIFDIDEKYLFWLCGSDSINYIKNNTLIENIRQYGLIAKENIVTENREKFSNIGYIAIEDVASEKQLKVVHFKVNENAFSYGYGDCSVSYIFKLVDSVGNKFEYYGSSSKVYAHRESNEFFTFKCKVVKHIEKMGVPYNILKIR
jgi:hypothetical protein